MSTALNLQPPSRPDSGLNLAVEALEKRPNQVSTFFLARGAETVGNTPEEFTTFTRNYLPKWEKVIKAAGIVAN